MRNDGKIIICLAVLFVFSLSFLIVTNENVSATSFESPYTKIHCKINISYIENNLCEEESCSPKVEKDKLGYWYYVDDVFGIYTEGDSLYVYSLNRYSKGPFNISEDQIDFISNICEPDITSILNYLNKNNLSKDWNDFYQYKPNGGDGHEITKIDDNWYLDSHSYIRTKDNPMAYITGVLYCFFLVPIVPFEVLMIGALFFFPIGIVFIIAILAAILFLISKKRMNNIYLLSILGGFIGGIIGFIYCYKKKNDKNLGLKLILIGTIVSIILFIFYYCLVILFFDC